jgi:crossover junction endonuclease MUS81
MQLILDHREGKLKELFQNQVDIKLDYRNLEYGDFCIFNNEDPFIIIERKTLDDLSSSIIDGRYKEQKQKMLSLVDRKNIYYIIEGSIKYTDSKKNIIGSVINTMIRDDIKIFFTKDVTDTYHLLLNIISRVTKEPEKYINTETAEIPVKKHSNGNSNPVYTTYKNMLCQIPGISNKAADAIIAVYPTFNLLYNTLEKLEDSEKLKLLKEIKQDSNRKISSSALNNILVNLFT